jgi:hypothetical protein
MNGLLHVSTVALVLGLAFCSRSGEKVSEPESTPLVLRCLNEHDFAIRFLYELPERDYQRYPLIVRAVSPDDPRLGVEPRLIRLFDPAYVSIEEMSELLSGISALGLVWKESAKPAPLEYDPFKYPFPVGAMEILATCPQGSATAYLDAKRICTDLPRLDAAFRTRRALWQFQRYRMSLGCSVPGFDWKEFPAE